MIEFDVDLVFTNNLSIDTTMACRDKVNIAFVVEAMRRDGRVQPEIFKNVPFNLLPQ